MTDDNTELRDFVRGALADLDRLEEPGDDVRTDSFGDRPDDVSEVAWERLSDDQRAELLALRSGDLGEDDESDEDEEEETAPLPGNQLRVAVRETVVGVLEDADGAWRAAGYDPEDVVIAFATMSPAAWAAYCDETGWNPSIRPGREDLPIELQTELTRRNLFANLERERGGYERRP